MIYTLAALFFLGGCSPKYQRNKEAREDAEKMAKALAHQAAIPHMLYADAETPPVTAPGVDDDAADDPAIWYNAAQPAASTIIGTNKVYGLHTYDLDAKELQSIGVGKINNADVRSVSNCDGQPITVLGGSNRSARSIDLFQVDEQGKVGQLLLSIDLGKYDPYGFALGLDATGQLQALVNDKHGEVRQYAVSCSAGAWQAELAHTRKLPRQVEGMVVDDAHQMLYVGEEEQAVHVFALGDHSDATGRPLPGTTEANPAIQYDIEGLALLPPHHLLISSQGNFSYAIYDLEEEQYVTSFAIRDGEVDGVEETDGLEVCPHYLNDRYPEGILVVQDGFNFDAKVKQNQNFKIIDLRKVKALYLNR